MKFKIQSTPKFKSTNTKKSFSIKEHIVTVVKKAKCIYGHKRFHYLKDYYYIEVRLSNPGRTVLYFYPELTLDNSDKIDDLTYEIYTPVGVTKYFDIYINENCERVYKPDKIEENDK